VLALSLCNHVFGICCFRKTSWLAGLRLLCT
jgi:hypothetical protein